MHIDASALRQKRIEQVLSVRELARLAGINHDAILQIERGERQPQPRTIRKLAAALNVAPWTLLLQDPSSAVAEPTHGAGQVTIARESVDDAID